MEPKLTIERVENGWLITETQRPDHKVIRQVCEGGYNVWGKVDDWVKRVQEDEDEAQRKIEREVNDVAAPPTPVPPNTPADDDDIPF